jgi:hypothetical protein
MVYVQDVGGGLCDTLIVRPAIVKVPVRWVAPVFSVTAYDTVPLPVPLLPLVMVSQLILLAAVHEHPADVVTVSEPVVAPEPSESELGETE